LHYSKYQSNHYQRASKEYTQHSVQSPASPPFRRMNQVVNNGFALSKKVIKEGDMVGKNKRARD
jgi:hypothetical protein